MNQDAAQQCISTSKSAMAAGDWDKAIRLLDKAIRLDPSNAVRSAQSHWLMVGTAQAVAHARATFDDVQAEAHVLKMKATSVRSLRRPLRIFHAPATAGLHTM